MTHKNNGGLIPIQIGITGHRDIPPNDWDKLEAALESEFIALRSQCPHSPVRLLTGLAEGADRLAARVALRQPGFYLVAVLPLQQSDYERDFETSASLAEFHEFLNKAELVITCTQQFESANSVGRSNQYAVQGRYIVQQSQIVFALWDGIQDQARPDGTQGILSGGTADVVRMCREGEKQLGSTQLTAPEFTAAICLKTRRLKHANQTQAVVDPKQVGQIASNGNDDQHKQHAYGVIAAIDRLNACLSTELKDDLSSRKEESRGYLIGSSAPNEALNALDPIIDAYTSIDVAAGQRQLQRNSRIHWVTGLALGSIFCQQVYSGPIMEWPWLASHIGLAMVAFAAFKFFFRGRHAYEEQYIDWRTLAEGLRVQIFWRASGLKDEVVNHYWSSQLSDIDWIRHALRNITTGVLPSSSVQADWVLQSWVKDQRQYFLGHSPGRAGKAALHKRKEKKFNTVIAVLFYLALAVTLLTLIMHLCGSSQETLNYAVLVSGMSFVSAAVMKGYAEMMGHAELSSRYRRMGELFDAALHQLEGVSADDKHRLAVIHKLGCEALAENSAWLQLHRQRQFEVNVA